MKTMIELFGNNTDAMLQNLEQQVLSSMHLLDREVSREYLEAVSAVPELVKKETPVENFLRCEDFHSLRAAKRIGLYWKTRKEFFEDRWLLPMTQTGEGALNSDQICILRSGYKVPVGCAQGEFVCVTDYSRLPEGVRRIDPAIFFYLATVNSCEPGQRDIVTMFYAVTAAPPVVDLIGPEVIHKLVVSLPYRLKNAIVARVFDPGREHLLEYLAFQQERRTERNLGTSKYIIGDSVRGTLNLLEEHGLDRSCIPFALGGDYFYSLQFSAWIRARLSVEGAMASAPPVRNSSTANSVATGMVACMPTAKIEAAISIDGHTTEDDDSGAFIKQSTGDGVSTNKTLVKQFPGEARESADDGDSTSGSLVKQLPGESREEFEKRRTSVYGRRSYQKKKLLVAELQKECECLRNSNNEYSLENRRIEALLAQARLIVASHCKTGDQGEEPKTEL